MADLTETQASTHGKKENGRATGATPCKEISKGRKEDVRDRVKAKGADTITVPEVHGEHAVGAVEENVSARFGGGQKLADDAETRVIPLRQSPNPIGAGSFGDADVLDHPG